MTVEAPWKKLVAKAVAIRDNSLAKIEPPLPPLPEDLPVNVTGIPAQVLTKEEVEITEANDATSLAAAIAGRKYTSEQVVRAFLRRAALAQKLVSSLKYSLT